MTTKTLESDLGIWEDFGEGTTHPAYLSSSVRAWLIQLRMSPLSNQEDKL